MIEPFDIEKAKAGAMIITGNGAAVKIVTYNRRTKSPFKILAQLTLSDGKVIERVYNERGFTNTMCDSSYDLRIKE